MKLLVVTCINENLNDVMTLFNKSAINVFSIVNATGIKSGPESDILENWFGSAEGEYDSVMLFSFTTQKAAEETMRQIRSFNDETRSPFPVRVFILPVDKAN